MNGDPPVKRPQKGENVGRKFYLPLNKQILFYKIVLFALGLQTQTFMFFILHILGLNQAFIDVIQQERGRVENPVAHSNSSLGTSTSTIYGLSTLAQR